MGKKRELKRLFLITTMIFALSINAFAVDEAGGEETVVLTELQKQLTRKVSVDFKDVPIENVIRVLAKQADVDIIKSPSVIGNVTATLTNIPLEEALKNILAAHGYGYVMSKNVIRVAPLAEINAADERLVSKVYQISYADVKEVESTLNKFLSGRGSIASNIGTNNLIITDNEEKIKAIDQFIEQIDRITPQILVEARIYDVSSTDALDIGINWEIGRNYTLSGDGAVVKDPFMFSNFTSGISKATGGGAFRFGILDEVLNIDAVISARQDGIEAKLLANPRVLVLDHHEAFIKIVEELPYQELTQSSYGGNIGTTEFKDVGVELIVTPHVARDGLIKLELAPKFSTRLSDVTLGSNVEGQVQSNQPVIATRETKTTALIRDGQTVVIGGLRKQTVNQEMSKIPLLGDLPILGGLFKFEGESDVVSELVVFITPRIIENPTLTPREVENLEATNIPNAATTPTILSEERVQ